MKHLLLALLFSSQLMGQGIVKAVYKDFLKYGTVYAAGDVNNSYEPARKEYMVRTPDGGSLYDIPIVEDVTDYFLIVLVLVVVSLGDLTMSVSQTTSGRVTKR